MSIKVIHMPVMRQAAPQPETWDRGRVLNQIAEASGVMLSANDALPDSLIAHAQGLGLRPGDLEAFICDQRIEHPWTTNALGEWAQRNGFAPGVSE